MSDYRDPSLRLLSDCDCCVGHEVQVPIRVVNRPGLDVIAYRIGTHSQFKQSLLTQLSTIPYPILRQLTTREDDDFTIALLDAWAIVADVLTFYQERIANESYLRTATERLSLTQLAHLLGYKPSPGVAASTYLAFTLEDTPRSPKPIMIEVGTRVQSLPGLDEEAQIFETVEAIEAQPEWNLIKPRTTHSQTFELGTRFIYIQGTSTQLRPGDPLLFVGSERQNDPGSERWDFRKVKEIRPDPEANNTYIELDRALGSVSPKSMPALNPKVYTLRQQAALFGYNAPDPKILPSTVTIKFEGGDLPVGWARINPKPDWRFRINPPKIDLDTLYSSIVPESWVVLSQPSYQELYRVVSSTEASQTRYTLSGKTTRLTLDTNENLVRQFSGSRLRRTVVFAQSEVLEIADPPYTKPLKVNNQISLNLTPVTLTPITGNTIELAESILDMDQGHILVISGKAIRVKVNSTNIRLTNRTGEFIAQIPKNSSLRLLSSPKIINRNQIRWHLTTDEGQSGYAIISISDLVLAGAYEDDPTITESVTLKQIYNNPSQLELENSLHHWYDRATTILYGNVALATHGEMKEEVLGSGDATQAFQTFSLRSKPLTYVSAPTNTGSESTLELRVNDIRWQEVPSLYGQGDKRRIYTTQADEEGKTTLRFGDGKFLGARLPSGIESIKARYRQGLGKAGNVKADQISLLLKRPLGVKSCTNPSPATGGDDPPTSSNLRREVPTTVLTFGRIVTRQDYEDFARTFAGIAKAHAIEIGGSYRTISVTVAGADGQPVSPGSELYQNLLLAINRNGDPFVNVHLQSYQLAHFRLAASFQVDPDFLPAKVTKQVRQSLLDTFSFESRALGQGVALSEVITAVQAVDGVVAVDINQFYLPSKEVSGPNTLLNIGKSTSGDSLLKVTNSSFFFNLVRTGLLLKLLSNVSPPQSVLRAKVPQSGDNLENIVAAELLLLDPNSLEDVGVQL